jgi:galactokinase
MTSPLSTSGRAAYERVQRAFAQHFGGEPTLAVRGHGRINIIGEHTDYNLGFVLPGAIDKSIYFLARPNERPEIRLQALDIERSGRIALDTAIERSDELWRDYLAGICLQFRERGYELPGLDIAFGGDLPVGSGMSSSAALECGMATLLNELTGAGLSGPEIAQLAKKSSNTFLEIPCGIMDQFASMMGQDSGVILLDCRSLEYEPVPVAMGDYEWVLINSNVSHELGDSAYGQRVRECAEGVDILQRKYPEVKSLRDATPALVEELREAMPENVYLRCHYVTSEGVRTQRAVAALRAGDHVTMGELLLQTHAGLRDEYEVSCPEVDFLVDRAIANPHVTGARIMGGGFGGCTINLVHREAAETFGQETLAAYAERFGRQGELYRVRLTAGTSVFSL